MSIRIACEGCGSRLKVADNLVGRKVKCPKCGNLVHVVETAVASAPRPRPAPAGPEEPRRQLPPEQLDELEPVEDDETEAPPDEELPRKRRRKKRRRPKKPSSFNMPAWVWWVSGVAFLLVMSVVAIAVAAVAGMKRDVITFAISFLIMLPISTIILVVSMIVSSALGGGMDFGDVRIAIPKAIILLFVVNAIGLLPYGKFLAFPIWLFGLMLLFDLDFWEVRFLIVINWGLNTLAIWFLLAAMTSGRQPGDVDGDDTGLPPAMRHERPSDLAATALPRGGGTSTGTRSANRDQEASAAIRFGEPLGRPVVAERARTDPARTARIAIVNAVGVPVTVFMAELVSRRVCRDCEGGDEAQRRD